MNRSPRNRLSFAQRTSILWLICLLFLFSSSGIFASLKSSGVNVGSRVHASTAAWDTQSVQGAGESGCTSPDFTQPATSPEVVGALPNQTAVGDFNLDGKPDLAVAISNQHQVSILLGNGMGDFSPAATSPENLGELSPFFVAVGDFNLDGKPDLAVANIAEESVSILLGNGMGDFTALAPETVGTGPTSVAVGDFNGDGKPDLAVANSSSTTVTILIGDGTGNFSPATTSPETAGNNPTSVVVGDFNLDGKLDLATANFVSNNVTILLGDGTGNFNSAATVSVGAGNPNPEELVVGDFNLDGKPDLAVANPGTANVTILLGTGTGNFTQPATSPEPAGLLSSSVTVGDFNLDGKPDLAAANRTSGDVTIMIGNGRGDFTAVSPTEPAGVNPETVTVGDFNLDGRPDLVTTNTIFGSGTVTILLNTCTARLCPPVFREPTTSPETTLYDPIAVAAGDFNRDGKPDLATVTQRSNTVTILLGDGTGDFTEPPTSPEGVGQTPISVVVSDFNGDGKPDLATTNRDSNNVTILLGDGTGNFTETTTSPVGVGSLPRSVSVGDFNLDGRPDLAVANEGSSDVTILLGDGTGNFTTASTEGGVAGPFEVAVGDFNLDGRPDLAVANQHSTTVTILLGDGTGNFAEAVGSPITVDGRPGSVAVGDFNHDGKPDLATANGSSNNVTILLGNGLGNFTPAATSPEGIGGVGRSVKVADFNLDGRADLAVVAGEVTILLGNGTGDFVVAGSAFGSGGPSAAVVCDFDLDGRPDLATANFSVNQVSILLARCISPPSITAQTGVTQVIGTTSNNVLVATVSDPDQSPETLVVTSSDFPFNGVTISNFTVDSMGNVRATLSATCSATDVDSFSLVVTDSTGAWDFDGLFVRVTDAPPTLNCPSQPVTANTAPGACTANVSFTVTATDNCDQTVSISCQPASGSAFPKGTTTVNCTATDGHQNTSTCSFSVVVTDNQNPQLTCPANISASTTSTCEAVNYPTPMASDNCTLPANAVVCTPPSGHCFPVGVTTVNCTVTDAAGKQASCSFTVTVSQCTIQCPANTTKNTDPNVCQAVVNYMTPTTTGSCGPVTCTPTSGSPFPKGTTTVNCTTQSGPSCSFTVTVTDAQPPQITCPANVTKGTDPNQCGAVVTYANATATDNCPGVGTPVCSPSSGSSFPKGVTTVTCTVKDAVNIEASCSFTITVNDTQPPAITCPANITKGTDANQCSAVVNYPAQTVTDNCPPASGGFTPMCTPPSGSAFPKGVTTVNCTVVDASNNSSSCSFTVTVNDVQNPAIACPANIVRPTDANACSAVVTFAPTANDNCPGVSVVCNPPSGTAFPKGATTVTCTATDASNRTGSCSFTVTVNDTQPPVIACPPNQTAVTVSVNDVCQAVSFTATSSDNCSGTAIVCNPPPGSCFPVGVTTVNCTATDQSSNTSTCSFTVTVFNGRLQDDSGACANTVLFNTLTGDYRWCCGTTTFAGRGTVTKIGSTFKIEHNATDRRVLINLSAGNSPPLGTGTLQSPAGTMRCTITDRDTRNDTCICGG